jgi:hypothetical protein
LNSRQGDLNFDIDLNIYNDDLTLKTSNAPTASSQAYNQKATLDAETQNALAAIKAKYVNIRDLGLSRAA